MLHFVTHKVTAIAYWVLVVQLRVKPAGNGQLAALPRTNYGHWNERRMHAYHIAIVVCLLGLFFMTMWLWRHPDEQ